MKTKLIKFFNLIKKDKQAKILTIMGIILLFIFTLGYSLSMFTSNQNNKVANIKVNDLSFNITTNSGETNDRILHLQAGKLEQFNIILTNLNKIDVKYEFTYELCNNRNCTETSKNIPSDISVSKEYESSEISGTINSNKTKSLTILTNNKSNNDYYIKLNLNAGYIWNDLELANQIKYINYLNKDIDIVAYVDGVEVKELPTTCFYSAVSTAYKDNNELKDSPVSFICNYATRDWQMIIDKISNIPDKLVVNFKSTGINAVEYVTTLQQKDINNENGLFIDPTVDKNVRYTGAEPRNYVEFNNETWRIVGVFNVKDSSGVTSKKLKLVRDESLGEFSWDSSQNEDRGGYWGKNDWSQAHLQFELNGDYLNYNLSQNTFWYNSYYDNDMDKIILRKEGVFDYTKVIKSNYQNMISESVWNIGGNDNNITTLVNLYNMERGTITSLNRPIVWAGKIGLIYASDYGFASNETECKNNIVNNCKNNNWLFKLCWYYTLSPVKTSSCHVYEIYEDGTFGNKYCAYKSHDVFPSLYLKSSINIISGNGSKSNPYKLN